MERRAAEVFRPPRERVPRQARSCPGRSSTLSRGSCTTSSTSGLGSRWSGRTGRWSGPNCRYLAGVGVWDGCGRGVPGGGWGRDSPLSEPVAVGGQVEPTCAAQGALDLATALPRVLLPLSRRSWFPTLTSCAVRASLGQPFWLLVWRLRGLLRRRPARASGAWGWAPLCGRVRRGGCWTPSVFLFVPLEMENSRRETGMGVLPPFPGSPLFPIWHVWPPPLELVRTCPLTATRLSRATTKHNDFALNCEVFSFPTANFKYLLTWDAAVITLDSLFLL